MSTPQEQLLGILQNLESKNFKTFKWYLQRRGALGDFSAIPVYCLENASREDTVDRMVQTYCEDAIKVANLILEKMKKKTPSVSKEVLAECQKKLKSTLRKRVSNVDEVINSSPLNETYTELYIMAGETGEVNTEHEVRQIEIASWKSGMEETTLKCEDIFKALPLRDKPRTVVTKGVAGIGKTVLTQKFTLDWAEDKTNRDIEFTFLFTFRELNMLKEQKYSLVKLVHHFFTEIEEAGISTFEDFELVFIFDGLDECRLPLNFQKTEIVTDITASTPVHVLLTNLIRGKLLPSAHIWITTRPAAASIIPPDCVDMVTEVRGFTDPQKEDYFKKMFRDPDEARSIISHIQASRSLHIMCHIPVFCWITAKVLEDMLKTCEVEKLPNTLTEMYIHFLVIQSKLKSVKYQDQPSETNVNQKESKGMIEALAKLAFKQLQKENPIFYEADLSDSGIDLREAATYSGVFTETFKKVKGMYKETVFCFVHLSVQEFLAALHVHLAFITSGVNLLSDEQSTSTWMSKLKNKLKPKQLDQSKESSASWKSKLFKDKPKLNNLHQCAIDKALLNPKGHLDLFLRFLLGLSVETNQHHIRWLLEETESHSEVILKTAKYIRKKIDDNMSAERSINLFHCLNELNHHSLVEEIQQSLSSGPLSTKKLSPAQWGALVFLLLSSDKDLNQFDLKKYSASEETFLRLLPVVKASNKVLLNDCKLSKKSCEALSSLLHSQSSNVKHVDLGNNELEDVGVEALSGGLKSPQCSVETLSLAGCLVTENGCGSLASALSLDSCHLKELDLSYNRPGDLGVKQLSTELKKPECSLQTLRLKGCELSERSCAALSSVLNYKSSSLRHLDLSDNDLLDSGVKQLAAGLKYSQCSLTRLSLTSCKLSETSCDILSTVFTSQSCSLKQLDLSYNLFRDSGITKLSHGLKSPHCLLETLSLAGCMFTEKSCGSLASVLSVRPSKLTELDLSYNKLEYSGVKQLCEGLVIPDSSMETLRLRSCLLSDHSCQTLSSVLGCQSSRLRNLDVSNNDLQDLGVEHLSGGLRSPHSSLEILRLSGCGLSERSSEVLSSVFSSRSSALRHLDLSNNDLQDSEVKELSVGLKSPCSSLETLCLSGCELSGRSCEALSSVLRCPSSQLRHLDLSNNDLQDSGVTQLSHGLKSSHCSLETLRHGTILFNILLLEVLIMEYLFYQIQIKSNQFTSSLAGCLVTEKGCASLASALSSNPSHLRELDLSYNHPGGLGRNMLIGGLKNSTWKLETVRLDHCGAQRIRPGLRKYLCELEVDVNTVNRCLVLSDNNRTVSYYTDFSKMQRYDDHPDRFQTGSQLLCKSAVTGRCYWEVEFNGNVSIALSYKGIKRTAVQFGNEQSWRLSYSKHDGYSVTHNSEMFTLSSPSVSNRVSVYVDCPAGTLSFYRVSSDSLIHLHTFSATFTGPVYPGFTVHSDSNLSLCSL
ncbi:NACHT, LRR and PYD domains-containing protein 12-like isoform X2 [Cynoglossus semilaevis]|nr:NACHT, LRR and PYD domains-containing protein 12-like isoform X2 [Cynoglossus semilaevis]